MPEGSTPSVSAVPSPRTSFAASSRSVPLSSPSTDNLQRPSLEANRAGYSAHPGQHQHGSTLSQLSARARGAGRLQRDRHEVTDKDNEAVLQPYDTNMGFALMQATQTITQALGSVTQGNQQFASTVNSDAQQLMGIITTAVR